MRRLLHRMAQYSHNAFNNPITKIGTHNGTFHCDDALACYMLKLLPQCSEAKIVRSRDSHTLDACDIIVDVGAVFDTSTHRYDHHQREFNETMHSLSAGKYPWATKLSSAGLVYFHFGHSVVSIISSLEMKDPNLEIIYQKIYEQFMEEIDANDNGISQYDGEPKFQVTTTVSSRVAALLPPWNVANRNFDEIFPDAMQLVGREFSSRIKGLVDVWLPAKHLVNEALMRAGDTDASGQIIMLDQFCPWKEHLFAFETEREMMGRVKYVLHQDDNGKWRIQCVNKMLKRFENRKSLPEPWRGLRDDSLSDIAGIDGCTFVHASGFTGGNATKEGVILMAKRALEFED